MNQYAPTVVLANRESDYRMVEIGRMKPYWSTTRCILNRGDGLTTPTCTCMDIRNCGRYHQGQFYLTLMKPAIAGDGIAILFFRRRNFGEGLFP